MFYNLLYPLADVFGPFNLFRYLTFRSIGAFLTALVLSFLIGGALIRWLRSKQRQGQPIRDDGPASHLMTKKGTPTMGGLMILAGLIVATILWANPRSAYMWIVPASVQGNWTLSLDGRKNVAIKFEQTFQNVGGTITVDGRSVPLLGAKLHGEDLSFQFRGEGQAVNTFSGKVSGNRLSGMLSTDRAMQSVDGQRL